MSELVLVNPKRRKRRKTRRKTARRNPVRRKRTTRRRVARSAPRRRRRSVRRNPKLSVKSISRDALIPAGVGAAGALALDITMGMVPIPANFKSGPLGSVTKIAGAIVLGKVVGKVMGKKAGDQATLGAVTILAYGAIKNLIATQMPSIPLSGSDFAYNPYPSGMGEYVGVDNQLGYMNAGVGVAAEPSLDEYVPSDGMGEMEYY